MYSKISTIKSVGIAICMLMFISYGLSAPPNQDDRKLHLRDLYEYMLERDMMAHRLNPEYYGSRQLVRKNTRSPSLRLRFGRRSDPYFAKYDLENEDYKTLGYPDIQFNEK